MRRLAQFFSILALCLMSEACSAPIQNTPATGQQHILTLGPNGRRIAARAFFGVRLSTHPKLIVIIHGDAPAHNPQYQYDFARDVALEIPDTVVLAILRPGYRDDAGLRSDGDRGMTTGDTYTGAAARQLIEAVVEAGQLFKVRDTILVGHSGGAALAVIMLAQRPDLASHALILSCPCDLQPWRRHMALRDFNPFFLFPVASRSPMVEIDGLSRHLGLRVMVGADDDVTPPTFSERFVAAALNRKLNAKLTIVRGAGHEILQHPEVLEALKTLP
jgi:pimeloyl-ACP methyl ester carboxylesterase